MKEDRPVSIKGTIYDLESSDPHSKLIDREGMDSANVRQIGQLMGALGGLRDAEQVLSEASLRYMKLNRNDMRAVHYLIATRNRGEQATPAEIAAHLGISTASTTKLLDRLEAGGHIRREPHPSDRRSLIITVTEQSHDAAMNTVGRQQSRRFHAAARLTPEERDVVIRFIQDMTKEILVGKDDWAEETPRS